MAGLDDILGGGFPVRHLYLLEGSPGSGKTTLGLQFLLDGVKKGECGLYITLSETPTELHQVAASHGWSLDGLAVFDLVNEQGLSTGAEQSILYPSEVELGETTRSVMAKVERVSPVRVVFDSLSEMRMLAQDSLRYRREILALKHFFVAHHCTVLMLDDRNGQPGDVQLHSIAHGVISLEQSVDVYGPQRRHLRVIKMRGVKFRGGEHDFNLETGGLSVFPRLIASEHRTAYRAELVSTGTPELDLILGGGLARGSNTLFSGPSGVGKTTTAMATVRAALQRGEKAAYYLFDEGIETLLQRTDQLEIPVRDYIGTGQLEVSRLDPAGVSPGEFASIVRQAVEQRGVQVVVIDSLNAYLQAMPGGKFLLLQMHELLTYLNANGIVSILVLGQHGLIGEVRADVDLSYISDALLLFRFFESKGKLLKALSVVKSRTTNHELTIRQFQLGKGGLEIGPELVDFVGVLTGVPSYHGKVPLLEKSAGTGAKIAPDGVAAGRVEHAFPINRHDDMTA